MAAAHQATSTAGAWHGDGLIGDVADVARVLADINATGERRRRTAAMAQAVRTADDVAFAEPDATRVLPVAPEIAEVLPWPGGLRRGATVAAVATGSAGGATSLILTLLADAIAAGSWGAVVGIPGLGAVSAAMDYGIELSRLALVPEPGPAWPEVVSALIDGVDIVVVAVPGAVAEGAARALMARARKCGCVLVTAQEWPTCEVVLDVVERHWVGLGRGRGRLRRQDITLRATGRGRASRPRETTTSLPPPSIAGRVGLHPGEIPGYTVEMALRRLAESEQRGKPEQPVVTRPAVPPVPAPPAQAVPAPVDLWAELTKQLPAARRGRR